jgi:glycosyltransferase involved in cell wall biosynthesis
VSAPLSPDVTVVIPTINSGRHIDIVLSYYRDHNLPVTVFVDDRSVDDTFEKAMKLTGNAIRVTNRALFAVEGMVKEISLWCPTKWLLRIDDDELPTLGLLEFIQTAIANESTAVFGFPRHQCAVSGNGNILRQPGVSTSVHRQWRLYQPAKVRYTATLHTPGIEWDAEQTAEAAPLEASLIHLDWALHSYEERKRKVEDYDAQSRNGGSIWRDYYLYEENNPGKKGFVELDTPEFAKVGCEISRRFVHLCV